MVQKTKEQWFHEAIIHFEAEHYEKALSACEQAIRLDPSYVKAFNGKGISYKIR